MLIPDTNRPEWTIECDSCLQGGGAYAGGKCYAVTYPPWLCDNKHISQLEAINLLIAVRSLGPPNPDGYRYNIRCDNEATVTSMNSGRTRDPWLARCARELWLYSAVKNVRIVVTHVPGAKMTISDALSRACLSAADATKARTLINTAGLKMMNIDLHPSMFNEDL